jgi:hypothetical protein
MALRRLLAGSLVVLVAACQGPAASVATTASPAVTLTAEASPSQAASETPVASAAPGASTTPEPVETPFTPACSAEVPYTGPSGIEPLLPGAAVRVTVAELNLREGPCTKADKIATLKKGALLIVADGETQCCLGPSKANGYPWYVVVWLKGLGTDGDLPALPADPRDGSSGAMVVGYIAAHDGSKSFVNPILPRCPTTVDFESLHAMLSSERLACFGAPVTVEGTYGCGGCGGAGGYVGKPQWLMGSENVWNFSSVGYQRHGPYLHFRPSGPATPPPGSIIRATVHVTDPAAQNCVIETLEGFVIPKQIGIAYCQERLVVDSYEILGTDPDFVGTG